MRVRTIFLILAIVLVAAFAALNVEEFMRSSVLSLGVITVQVPLGLVMLVLLAIAVLLFLATTVYMQSSYLLETRRHTKELEAQRDLADRAEASRFIELRNHLEAQAAAAQNRETAHATVMAERLAQLQSVLMQRLEQSDNSTAAYIGQLDDTLARKGGAFQSKPAGGTPLQDLTG